MKFWQKAYICIIITFIIGFDIAIFTIVDKSYSLSAQEKYATADDERYIIQNSIQTRLSSVSDLYDKINADNLNFYITPYGEYYINQGIYLELYYKDEIIYSNFPHNAKEETRLQIKNNEKGAVTREIDGTRYHIIAKYLDNPHSAIKFVYIKDIQSLVDYKTQIIRYAIIISVIVTAILSATILFLLLKLTSPIKKLNLVTKEIADGNYEKRICIDSNDEIGEFAKNFNTMADSVQNHIQVLSTMTQERQRFIDNLAHEMRTPLTAISGYGEFLKYANYTAEEKRKALDYIIYQSERMKNMGNKLLDLAHLNRLEITPESIDLSQILTYVEDTLKDKIKEKNIKIEKDFQVITMSGDKDLIESLILNLMENALRALQNNGEIKITTTKTEKGFILSLLDNGLGMDEQELLKVFEPFYRIDKSRSRSYGGVGLGLALCKQICELHGAEVEISSQPNIGTTIVIKFTN